MSSTNRSSLKGKEKKKQTKNSKNSQQGFPLRGLTAAPKNQKDAKGIGHPKKKKSWKK